MAARSTVHGFSEEQSEALVEGQKDMISEMAQGQLSTKADIVEVEDKISEVEKSLTAEISNVEKSLRAEISNVEKSLKAEISNVEKSLKAEVSNVEKSLRSDFSTLEKSLRSDISELDKSTKTETSSLREAIHKLTQEVAVMKWGINITLAMVMAIFLKQFFNF